MFTRERVRLSSTATGPPGTREASSSGLTASGRGPSRRSTRETRERAMRWLSDHLLPVDSPVGLGLWLFVMGWLQGCDTASRSPHCPESAVHG